MSLPKSTVVKPAAKVVKPAAKAPAKVVAPVVAKVLEVPPVVAPIVQVPTLVVSTPAPVISALDSAINISTSASKRRRSVLGITGPTGSGKTTNAIIAAESILANRYPELNINIELNEKGNLGRIDPELSKKIGFIDMEHGRANGASGQVVPIEGYGMYEIGSFQVVALDKNFSHQAVLAAKNALKNAGCEVLIIDSLTMMWEHIKDKVNRKSKEMSNGRAGSDMRAWADVADDLKKLTREIIVDNDIDVISCMRAKTDYITEEKPNASGKISTSFKEVGIKSDMKGDVNYEFDLSIMLDSSTHAIYVQKDNTNIFDTGAILSPDLWALYYKWLENELPPVVLANAKIKEYMATYGTNECILIKQDFLVKNGLPKDLKSANMSNMQNIALFNYMKLRLVDGVEDAVVEVK